MLRWIWCDIGGLGRHWRLAFEREDDMLYFPRENFEENQEVLADYPSIGVEPPDFIPEVRCCVCKQPRPATKEWAVHNADGWICKKCWTDIQEEK